MWCLILSHLLQDAPPLIPALSCGKYCIKWKQLADIPAQLYGAYVTMQDKRIFVSGAYSPSMQTVYVYDINDDFWKQLPLSDHYGVPHIISGRLALIGGRLSSTKNATNKVSTFDEACQKWMSYYPDLLYARYRPGVVTYLEHIIVAGGMELLKCLMTLKFLTGQRTSSGKERVFVFPDQCSLLTLSFMVNGS